MKNIILGLVVVGTLLILTPPAHALNCTIYQRDQNSLCNSINPLSSDEGYKQSLMNPALYGSASNDPGSVNLEVPQETSNLTFESIYKNNIVIIVNLAALILVNYLIFSILTKSSWLRKWLTVDF